MSLFSAEPVRVCMCSGLYVSMCILAYVRRYNCVYKLLCVCLFNMYWYSLCVHHCMCVCVCVCMCVYAHVCVCLCTCACMCTPLLTVVWFAIRKIVQYSH